MHIRSESPLSRSPVAQPPSVGCCVVSPCLRLCWSVVGPLNLHPYKGQGETSGSVGLFCVVVAYLKNIYMFFFKSPSDGQWCRSPFISPPSPIPQHPTPPPSPLYPTSAHHVRLAFISRVQCGSPLFNFKQPFPTRRPPRRSLRKTFVFNAPSLTKWKMIATEAPTHHQPPPPPFHLLIIPPG